MIFLDWIATTNGLIALISGLLGLIVTAVSAYFAIKAYIKAAKEKSATEIWNMVQEVAKTAMEEVERAGIVGSDEKKFAAIEIVKKSCAAAGLDISMFLDQLGNYIDSCIKFYNQMKDKEE